MAQRRLIYFLAHIITVVVGAFVTLASSWMEAEWQKATLFALGTSIAAAGLCGMVVWVYIASSEQSLALLKVLDAAGLEWLYPSRAAQIRGEYAARLKTAGNQIDILGFGLKDFKRDYMNELGSLSKRARVRILVLDPSSPHADQRDIEEGQGVGVIKAEIDEFVRGFRALYGDGEREQLELRTYRSLPEVNIFRIDDEIFWGPYLVGKASGNTLTMRVRRGGFVFESLEAHFERIWTDFSEAV